MTPVHEALDKTGEVATSVISSAAGAVADPKTAVSMLKDKATRIVPFTLLALLAVALVLLRIRRRN